MLTHLSLTSNLIVLLCAYGSDHSGGRLTSLSAALKRKKPAKRGSASKKSRTDVADLVLPSTKSGASGSTNTNTSEKVHAGMSHMIDGKWISRRMFTKIPGLWHI